MKQILKYVYLKMHVILKHPNKINKSKNYTVKIEMSRLFEFQTVSLQFHTKSTAQDFASR